MQDTQQGTSRNLLRGPKASLRGARNPHGLQFA